MAGLLNAQTIVGLLNSLPKGTRAPGILGMPPEQEAQWLASPSFQAAPFYAPAGPAASVAQAPPQPYANTLSDAGDYLGFGRQTKENIAKALELTPIGAAGMALDASAAGDPLGTAINTAGFLPLGAMPAKAGKYGAMLAADAWHGTPHRWPSLPDAPLGKVDLSKVGTGEGAQAYGWGFYTAGNPKVAEGYRDQLTGLRTSKATSALKKANGDIDGAVEITKGELDRLRALPDKGNDAERWARMVQYKEETLAELDTLKKTGGMSEGSLYKLRLAPDDADYLQWDKPLSEQSEKVRAVLEREIAALPGSPRYKDEAFLSAPTKNGGVEYKATGGTIYSRLADIVGGQKAASEALAAAGIPGIRYLDAGSRGAGEGTFNYVIFDPSAAQVLERNGEAALDMSESATQARAKEMGYGPKVDTSTPEFREWFGSSKVVDAAGEPVVVYHGTGQPIGEGFDKFQAKGTRQTDAPGFAHFFTDSPKLASSYAMRRKSGPAPAVYPTYLSLKNPLVVDPGPAGASFAMLEAPIGGRIFSPKYGQEITVQPGDPVDINTLAYLAASAGHDGMIVRNVTDHARKSDKGLSTTYAVFDPSQIRSKFAAFDPAKKGSSDLLASLAAALGGTGAGMAAYYGTPGLLNNGGT